MPRTILIADDSVTIQKVVELTFMDEDYEVEAVGDGSAAIASLERRRPDLVIADVHMPGADGYEVCRQAKARYGDLPVLLLVGTFEPFDASAATRAGSDGHLKKPFDAQDLLEQVDRLIDRAQSADGQAAGGQTAPIADTAESASGGFELDVDTEDLTLSEIPSPGVTAERTETVEAFDEVSTAPEAAAFETTAEVAEEPLETPRSSPPSPFETSLYPLTFDPDDEPDTAREAPPASAGQAFETSFMSPEETAELAALSAEVSEDGAPTEELDLHASDLEVEAIEDAEGELELAEAEPWSEPQASEPQVSEPQVSEPPVSEPPVSEPAAAETAAAESVPASNGSGLSNQDVERIARRVVELIGDGVLREVAWEVVPDLAEVVIKERLRELERQVE